MELIKEWWQFFVWLGGCFIFCLFWIFRIQRDLNDIKEKKIMTIDICNERQTNCDGKNQIRFGHGADQFQKLEVMIIELRKDFAQQRRDDATRHEELMKFLIQSN